MAACANGTVGEEARVDDEHGRDRDEAKGDQARTPPGRPVAAQEGAERIVVPAAEGDERARQPGSGDDRGQCDEQPGLEGVREHEQHDERGCRDREHEVDGERRAKRIHRLLDLLEAHDSALEP